MVATRLVLPTPPASEKTAITGARAVGAGAACAEGAVPSRIPRNAYHRAASRSRDPCSVSSGAVGIAPAWPAGSCRSGINHAGRPAVSFGSGPGQGFRGGRLLSSRIVNDGVRGTVDRYCGGAAKPREMAARSSRCDGSEGGAVGGTLWGASRALAFSGGRCGALCCCARRRSSSIACSKRCRAFSRVCARDAEKSRYFAPCRFAQEYSDATSSGVSFSSNCPLRSVMGFPSNCRHRTISPAYRAMTRLLQHGTPGKRTRTAGILTGNPSGQVDS